MESAPSSSMAAQAATSPPPKRSRASSAESPRNTPSLRPAPSRWRLPMSELPMPGFTVVQKRPRSFYSNFDRKGELQHQTHYCPGCGHGMVHKLLAQALDELGVQDRTVLISPVGCSV